MNKLKRWLKRFAQAGTRDTRITDLESYAEFSHSLSTSNPFRLLSGKELEAVTLLDNRMLFKSSQLPNNSIFLTAPHWSTDTKFMYLNYHDRVAANTQNGIDIGAFEVCCDLSEKLSWIAITSNASKLLIDYNKSLTNRHSIPSFVLHKQTIDPEFEGDKIKLDLNSFPSVNERGENYYLEYHKIIKEVLDFLNPKYHIDIHTYELLNNYSPKQYHLKCEDIGIQLFSYTNSAFYQNLKFALESNDLKV